MISNDDDGVPRYPWMREIAIAVAIAGASRLLTEVAAWAVEEAKKKLGSNGDGK